MNTDYLFVKFPTMTYERPSDSFIVPREIALDVARYLKEDPLFRLDMCTNCTAVDWLPTTNVVKRKTIEIVDGKQVETVEEVIVDKPAYLETVYHLVSVEKKHGPLVIRVRTKDRVDTRVPSLTPVWRGCELQEREAYDLTGLFTKGIPTCGGFLCGTDLSITRCAKITSSRMITNTSRPPMTRCSRKPGTIIPRLNHDGYPR